MSHRRTLALVLVPAVIGAMGYLWSVWCEFPFQGWNDVRLAPTFALREGINPYPLLNEGPLFTWIYGPVGLFLNLPATFGDSAVSALQITCLINLVIVFAPVAIVFFASSELGLRGIGLTVLALALTIMLMPQTIRYHVADHSAIAFGLLSCWCLARPEGPNRFQVAVAAACCAFAVWSKQIAICLVPAHIAFLAWSGARRAAIQYGVCFAVFAGGLGAMFAARFGFQNLWLNLISIPEQIPWAEFSAKLRTRPREVDVQVFATLLSLPILWLLRPRAALSRGEGESDRFLRIAVLAGIAMLPAGLASFFKTGGSTNSLHGLAYLVPAAVLYWLSREKIGTPTGAVRVLGALLVALAVRAVELSTIPPQPFTRHLEAAAAMTTSTAGAFWFPQHPVLNFYTTGRLWHSEDGILTRYITGHGQSPDELQRHLPPRMTGVVYFSAISSPAVLQLVPEFSHAVKWPYWNVYTRDPIAITSL
jgi:hypothetical protein